MEVHEGDEDIKKSLENRKRVVNLGKKERQPEVGSVADNILMIENVACTQSQQSPQKLQDKKRPRTGTSNAENTSEFLRSAPSFVEGDRAQ